MSIASHILRGFPFCRASYSSTVSTLQHRKLHGLALYNSGNAAAPQTCDFLEISGSGEGSLVRLHFVDGAGESGTVRESGTRAPLSP